MTKTMDKLLDGKALLVPYHEGETIEVEVLNKSKKRILVDLFKVATGVIPEREYSSIVDEIEPGDKILAQVIHQENDEGMVILSLKRADRERIWQQLQEQIKSGENLWVKVKDANRGGLVVEYQNLEGFLPLSQLRPDHYPRIGDNATANQILEKISGFIGQKLQVKIINPAPAPNNLIFSEKLAYQEKAAEEELGKIKVGKTYEGEITGLADFGLFVKIIIPDELESRLSGLVHLSELDWEKDEQWQKKYQIGQKIKVQIIGTTHHHRLALSIKRLLPDPWQEAAKKYRVGQVVTGTVSKLTPFGSFVKLEEKIEAMAKIIKELKEGEKRQFKITKIDLPLHRISVESVKKEKTAKKVVKKA